MRKVKYILTKSHVLTVYYSLVYPYLDYGITLWGTTHKTYINKIRIMQKKAIRIISNSKYNDHTEPLFKELKVLKLDDIKNLKISKCMFALHEGILPSPLMTMFRSNHEIHQHNTRNKNNPHIEPRKTNRASNSLRHTGPSVWYQIPSDIRQSFTLKIFTYKFKKHVLQGYNSR